MPKDILHTTTIGDLLATTTQEVLVLYSDMTIATALAKLSEKRCTSAPVKAFAEQRYLGVLHVLDVVKYAVESLGGLDELRRKNFKPFFMLASEAFFDTTIDEIVGKAHTGPFPYIPMSSAVVPLAKLFSEVFAKEIHRVPIADAQENITHILTQSDAVKWIYAHLDELHQADERIDDLGLVAGTCISAHVKDPVLEAFDKILTNKVQGIALTNAAGELVGSLSGSDLKGVTKDEFHLLSHVAGDFLVREHAAQTHMVDPRPLPKPVSVTAGATLRQVVKTLVEHRIHRVFVVDDDNKPIGVVTLTNVIEAVSL